MNKFPLGGDIAATRVWLDSKGFDKLFVGWEADALLGKSEDFIMSKFSGNEDKGEILCGLLNTARKKSAGKLSPPIQYHQP